MVPGDKVYDARLKLAGQGLPKAGNIGFEVLENQKLGTSQFVEQVNYQRALESELSSSIKTLAQVREARVHLAIPKLRPFCVTNPSRQHPWSYRSTQVAWSTINRSLRSPIWCLHRFHSYCLRWSPWLIATAVCSRLIQVVAVQAAWMLHRSSTLLRSKTR